MALRWRQRRWGHLAIEARRMPIRWLQAWKKRKSMSWIHRGKLLDQWHFHRFLRGHWERLVGMGMVLFSSSSHQPQPALIILPISLGPSSSKVKEIWGRAFPYANYLRSLSSQLYWARSWKAYKRGWIWQKHSAKSEIRLFGACFFNVWWCLLDAQPLTVPGKELPSESSSNDGKVVDV